MTGRRGRGRQRQGRRGRKRRRRRRQRQLRGRRRHSSDVVIPGCSPLAAPFRYDDDGRGKPTDDGGRGRRSTTEEATRTDDDSDGRPTTRRRPSTPIAPPVNDRDVSNDAHLVSVTSTSTLVSSLRLHQRRPPQPHIRPTASIDACRRLWGCYGWSLDG